MLNPLLATSVRARGLPMHSVTHARRQCARVIGNRPDVRDIGRHQFFFSGQATTTCTYSNYIP